MQPHKRVLGQAIRFASANADAKPSKYNLVQAARMVEERYGFKQGPRSVAEYAFETGVTFSAGMFERTTPIEKFQIYERGLLCDLLGPTSVCDAFLDDVMAWARSELELDITEDSSAPRAYMSQMDVVLETPIATAFSILEKVGNIISDKLNGHGHHLPPYSMAGFKLQLDPALEALKPTDFSFERRAGIPYAENVFYSAAPLTTDEHWELLKELERLLSA